MDTQRHDMSRRCTATRPASLSTQLPDMQRPRTRPDDRGDDQQKPELDREPNRKLNITHAPHPATDTYRHAVAASRER